MAGILILLLASFILFFVLSRMVLVRIIKGDGFKIEIHLPILALHLINRNEDKSSKNKKSKISLSPIGYIRIITNVADRLKGTEISVKTIALPIKAKKFSKAAILRPLRQQAAIYTLIAYLRTKAEKLVLDDNTIILSPDIDVLHCYVTLKIRLYRLIYSLITVMHDIRKEKKRRRG